MNGSRFGKKAFATKAATSPKMLGAPGVCRSSSSKSLEIPQLASTSFVLSTLASMVRRPTRLRSSTGKSTSTYFCVIGII